MLLMTYLKVFNMIISRNEANVSTNSSDEKVIYKIDCYILHALLLVIILLLIITLFLAIIMQNIGQNQLKITAIPKI